MLRFNIKDCEISVSTGFFAVITLMLITCETRIVLYSLLCSLFHELGHITAMLFFGERLRMINFSVVGIRIDKFSVTALSYKQEAVVSLAGIFFNCLLAIVAFGCYGIFSFKPACDIAIVSLMVGGFNLLPVDSLDGARALRYALMSRVPERQADSVIFTLSVICVALLLILAVATLCFRKANFSLVAVTVYLGAILVCHVFSAKR